MTLFWSILPYVFAYFFSCTVVAENIFQSLLINGQFEMSNLHVTQLVLASAVMFLPGVGTGEGGLTFWRRRGKCVICGENEKKIRL